MDYELGPIIYDMSDLSPELGEGRQGIALAFSDLHIVDDLVQVRFHVSFLFPSAVAERYRRQAEALVIVIHDINQRDGFAVRTADRFFKRPADEMYSRNLLHSPPLPLPPRGEIRQAGECHGGWLSSELWFTSPRPLRRPSIYAYGILENYVSNVVALDLVDTQILSL